MSNKELKNANDLIHENSPYLLQHAYNPVHWKAWNDKTWERARLENKLVIISIGYSACHWCHVMEHESFEDQRVAELMNEHFVNIKVDREERPDVDQIYMDACQLINNSGGWPLNAIALPDGRPIYAGTYYPKEHWIQLLQYFADYWQKQPEEAMQRATQITQGIRSMDIPDTGKGVAFDKSLQQKVLAKIDAAFDYEYGGRMGAPKFPMPVLIEYLLHAAFYTGNEKAKEAAITTLNRMMDGGIYDHVGGGFARYSVDAYWEIPHFEKMLYDNAQLVSLYAQAYALTGNERYKQVVDETTRFLEREMQDESGAFFSALDADSEGEEGKFYVWTQEELKQMLGEDFHAFEQVYHVPLHGNFEGHIHITRKPYVAVSYDDIRKWQSLLLHARSTRVRPGLDDKVITAWNALMLKGYCDAYRYLGDERYLNIARRLASFIETNLLQADGSLNRIYKNGKSSISGFMDDYSFTSEAFLALYEITFEPHFFSLVKQLTSYAIQHFYNIERGLFYYTSVNDTPLIARKTETSDNVIPSSNSAMFKVLYKLSLLDGNEGYRKMCEKAWESLGEQATMYPYYYANWNQLSNWFIVPPIEVVITGKNALEYCKQMAAIFHPGLFFAGAQNQQNCDIPAAVNGRWNALKTTIYVCRNRSCNLPVLSVNEAFAQIAEMG